MAHSVSEWSVSDKVTYWAVCGQLKMIYHIFDQKNYRWYFWSGLSWWSGYFPYSGDCFSLPTLWDFSSCFGWVCSTFTFFIHQKQVPKARRCCGSPNLKLWITHSHPLPIIGCYIWDDIIAYKNIFGSSYLGIDTYIWSLTRDTSVKSAKHESVSMWPISLLERLVTLKRGEWLPFLYQDISACGLQQPEPQKGLLQHMLSSRHLDRCLSRVQRFTPKSYDESSLKQLCKTPIWSPVAMFAFISKSCCSGPVWVMFLDVRDPFVRARVSDVFGHKRSCCSGPAPMTFLDVRDAVVLACVSDVF